MTTILSGHILVPESELPTVQAALPEHIRLTRQEPGCLVFEVTPDPENPLRYNVYEEFVDLAAFEAHQARVKQSYWGEVTAGVERVYEVREVGE